MKLYVEDLAVFEDQAARMSLMRMFVRAALGQHSLVVSDSARVLGSWFFQSVAEMDRQEWSELIQRTLGAHDAENRTEEPGARPKGIHASIGVTRAKRTATCRFPLSASEAGEWTERPLRLLLENNCDWSLIEAFARACEARTVEDAYLQGWLVADGRGGCGEVLNSLRGRVERDRLFAFIDQDPDPVQRKPSATCRAIERECREDPFVPLHVTEKHEIENYVPRAVIEPLVFQGKKPSKKRARNPAPRSKHARLLEWDELTDAQKDMDDLKARFGKALMEKAIEALGGCDAKDLLERAGNDGKELRDLFAKIEEHL